MALKTNQKPEKSNIWRQTAYQKAINAGKAISGLILTCSLVAAAVIYFTVRNLNTMQKDLFYCILLFLIGLIGLVIFIHKQDTADDLYSKLIVIWQYKPSYVYKFIRYNAFKERPTKSLNYLYTAIGLLIFAVISSLNPIAGSLPVWLYILMGICLLFAIINLPVLNIFTLKVKNSIFGTAKGVILSRGGIYSFGSLYKFGTNSFTFHKAYKKQIGPFDAVVFTYQRMRGYQILLREISVPIPPDVSEEEIKELLDLYNSSELYMHDTL